MRRLTMQQVNDECGGKLPTDAVLIPEAGPSKPKPAKQPARRRKARFAVLNTFADFSLAPLTGSEVKVWLILYRDTKADTGTARTGQTDIARRAGLSVRGVQKIVARLQGLGLLHVVKRGRLNAGPTVYRVLPTVREAEAS